MSAQYGAATNALNTVESASFGNRVAAKRGKCCPNEISPLVEIYTINKLFEMLSISIGTSNNIT